jgi:hypothetical protein
MLIRDGDMEMWARAAFHDAGDGRSRLKVHVDMPIEETMKEHLTSMMQGACRGSSICWTKMGRTEVR